MDDLKLFARNSEALGRIIRLIGYRNAGVWGGAHHKNISIEMQRQGSITVTALIVGLISFVSKQCWILVLILVILN